MKGALLALALPALLAGCLAGAPPPAQPTGQIDGAVVDQLLRPFENQTVYLSPLGWTDATSHLGGFTFRNVPVGSYMLIAARPGTQGAAASVQVEEGRITKTILQMMPTPVRDPRIVLIPPHDGFQDTASAQAECTGCAWTVPLDGPERPAEIILEAHWDASLLGHDDIRFDVSDQAGRRLYHGDPESPSPSFSTSILGADLPSDIRELHVRAWFGPDFTPRANFEMQTFMTVYYGETHDEVFAP